MPNRYTTTRRVEFSDTDMAGIAHFSNFFRWMESAEHEFFRSLGVTVHGEVDGLSFGFVRVHASCDYAKPVRYHDLLGIDLEVTAKNAKAFAYDFVFRIAEDARTGEPGGSVARGRLEVVCVTRHPGEERLRAVDVPPTIVERLAAS